jgi:hypothetical protein
VVRSIHDHGCRVDVGLQRRGGKDDVGRQGGWGFWQGIISSLQLAFDFPGNQGIISSLAPFLFGNVGYILRTSVTTAVHFVIELRPLQFV